MKYKTVGIIGCAVVLIAGIINWHAVFKTDEGTRYHQHLEAQEKKNSRLFGFNCSSTAKSVTG